MSYKRMNETEARLKHEIDVLVCAASNLLKLFRARRVQKMA